MGQLLLATWKAWREDDATVLAAALAYFTSISVAPLLVLIVALVGLFVGRQAAQDQLLAQSRAVVGAQGTEFIAAALANASQPTLASAAGILSFALLVWASTNVFTQLHNALNKIWLVDDAPGSLRGTVRGTVRSRLLAFAMVLVAAFLLMVFMVLSTTLAALARFGVLLLPGSDWVWQLSNYLVMFVIGTLLFAVMFKVLPDAHIAWRDVLLGAAVTSLLFGAGNYVLGLYLVHAGPAYGTVASFAVFLLWVFYSAQIFFFGAEFAKVYSHRYGSGVRPHVTKS
jgi:membrane protein